MNLPLQKGQRLHEDKQKSKACPGGAESLGKRIEGPPEGGRGKAHCGFSLAPEWLWEEQRKDEHQTGSTSVPT